jgi:multidrug resistance efflux pump
MLPCFFGLTLAAFAIPSFAGDEPIRKLGDEKKDTAVVRGAAVVQPARQAHVNPKVQGQVAEVLVDVGDEVKAGQVLARLDRAELELKVKRAEIQVLRSRALLNEAEAKVAESQEEIKRAEADVKLAAAQRDYEKKKLERLRELLRAMAISSDVLEEAEAKYRAAEARLEQATAALRSIVAQQTSVKARVEMARAEIAAAEVERDLAAARLKNTEVRAPAAGTVLARHVDVGDTVGPAQANGRIQPFFVLADLAQLEAVVNIPANGLSGLEIGQKCELRVDAVPGVVYAGKLSQIVPVIATKDRTATVHVKLDLPRDTRRLLPGMTGEVRILAKE